MNERLKQLLGQAYDEAVPETWNTLSSEQLDRVYAKFAELIVRESIELLKQNDYHGEWLGEKIKEHFGVE